MIKFEVHTSAGLRTTIQFDENEIGNYSWLNITPEPSFWFGERIRGGRAFTDHHGWTIMPGHIVMFKRLED